MDFSKFSQVEIDPGVMGGTPVLKGTRIPLSRIFYQLADGMSVANIADDFGMGRLEIETLKNLLRDMGTGFQAFGNMGKPSDNMVSFKRGDFTDETPRCRLGSGLSSGEVPQIQKPLSEIELENFIKIAQHLVISGNAMRLIAEREMLMNEVSRLKRGDFTPEEFQNLCQNTKST